ncbi:hypothetical protein OG474_45450 [Kribbella sp. NBC_01505]|uniref:hypothetical protein n=1 Tax=Kribbella sp. NBC_01505 TaxID=2903580 RepID=UPI00386C4F80
MTRTTAVDVRRPRASLLAECARAVADVPGQTWLLAGSFGRREEVWHAGVPVSDLDLIALTDTPLTAVPAGLLDLETRYRTGSESFRLDIKQISRTDLPKLAGTLLGRDLAEAVPLTGPAVELGQLAVPPALPAAHFLVANRYAGWLHRASWSTLHGESGRWQSLLLQLSTCNIVLACVAARLIAVGAYTPRIADQRRLVDRRLGPDAAEVFTAAAQLRASGVLADVPAIALWREWAPSVLRLLDGLFEPAAEPSELAHGLSGWTSEAGRSEVRSIPPDDAGTPQRAKHGLQTSTIILAHCLADPGLQGQLAAVADSSLPGWTGSWSSSRDALLDTWQEIRRGGRA